MISDERLRVAARQAEKKLLASLPEPEECEATFSPEFKQKMKKLVCHTDHPIDVISLNAPEISEVSKD